MAYLVPIVVVALLIWLFVTSKTEDNIKKNGVVTEAVVSRVKERSHMPTWFKNGMIAAMMAPTAINQQKFFVELDGEEAVITAKRGPFAKVDLGNVKYHFEAVSGHKCR